MYIHYTGMGLQWGHPVIVAEAPRKRYRWPWKSTMPRWPWRVAPHTSLLPWRSVTTHGLILVGVRMGFLVLKGLGPGFLLAFVGFLKPVFSDTIKHCQDKGMAQEFFLELALRWAIWKMREGPLPNRGLWSWSAIWKYLSASQFDDWCWFITMRLLLRLVQR